jgi:hypothetical protein
VALGRPGFEPGRIARMAEFKAIPRPRQGIVPNGKLSRCGKTKVTFLALYGSCFAKN